MGVIVMLRNLFFTALLIIANIAPMVVSSPDGLPAVATTHVATHLGEGATRDGSVKRNAVKEASTTASINTDEGQQYEHKMEKKILGRKAAGGGRFGAAAASEFASTTASSTAGFVAFTSDYHSPRHHPPKNN
ncbi:unnamed protein product [Linum trigynum]|uniref:Uncharacterized protein n=1 Tax=Linum trigynum TaxID=586398 RepID=A0AAV2FBC7_9ROSI